MTPAEWFSSEDAVGEERDNINADILELIRLVSECAWIEERQIRTGRKLIRGKEKTNGIYAYQQSV